MGVTGLWRLIEPAGNPVPIETLENKILAVDISIWLHQMVKGYQDARGAPIANAHLLGLFQRLCKLLYYRIKPVFVFDGGYPELKRETIAKRHDSKAKFNSESERLKREILLVLGKRTAIGSILGEPSTSSSRITVSPKKRSNILNSSFDEDLFKLPEIKRNEEEDDSSETEEENCSTESVIDINSIDVESKNFKNLPLREKHDLLTELKETRKMNSWGRLHELPKQRDDFSDFQMQRLLKRRKVQECLEETEKEMGGNYLSMNELEMLMNEEGISTLVDSIPTKRIAYDNTTRYLLIKDVKQAMQVAKDREMAKQQTLQADAETENEIKEENVTKNEEKMDKEEEEELQRAIQMSLQCEQTEPKRKSSPESTFMLDTDYEDSEEETAPFVEFTSAKAFILQYSDFTKEAVEEIVASKSVINKPQTKKGRKTTTTVNMIKANINMSDQSESDSDLIGEVKAYQQKLVKSDSTQKSCVETVVSDYKSEERNTVATTTEVIELDSTEEEAEEKKSISGTSDDDFEEVEEEKPKVVTLDLDFKDVLEDDIFADVFEKPIQNQVGDRKRPIKDVSLTPKVEEEEEDKSTPNKENTEIEDLKKSILLDTIDESFSTEHSEHKQFMDISKRSTKLDEHFLKESEPHVTKIEPFAESDDVNSLENNELVSVVRPDQSDSNENESDLKHVNEDTGNLSEIRAHQIKDKVTKEELKKMDVFLESEQEGLMQEKAKLDRIGRNISEEMTRDAKELLKLFGIPFIVAPMEAEAQCAFLETVQLTDGTITDDSDIWLFGGRTVYKNFFNQRKHVLQFQSERIESSFKLSREQLILLALLVGSDYTSGVNGVGPVTAMEILASFPCRKYQSEAQNALNVQSKTHALLVGLEEFKRWVKSGKKTDDTSLRKKLKNIAIFDDFPSARVVQAYLQPTIDESRQPFSWGKPDVTILRDYARNKFGWNQTKFDEIFNPVLKRMEDHKSQKRIQEYFKRKIEFHPLDDQLSKRVKSAVGKLTGSLNETNSSHKQQKSVNNDNCKQNKVVSELFEGTKGKTKPKRTKRLSNVVSVENQSAELTNNDSIDIKIPLLNKFQEIIPQREKDRINVVQTRLKAIELYRKSKIDKKTRVKKKTVVKPKEDAGLSESDSD